MDRTEISERIRREARVAGLRDARTPSLEAVERRRMQLWILTVVLVVALSSGAVVLSMWPGRAPDLASPAVLRLGIVLLSLAFCAYAIEKELHLRRLTRLLTDEQELLEIIAEQSKRLAGMVDDLLAAARFERKEEAPALEEIDLAALARLAVRDLGIAGRPVELEAPEHAPVVGDALLLRRILDNLLDNAHKYGAPPVRLVVEPQGERILLSVLDAGAGVPEEARERIFERFARLDDHRSKPGLGLGLPIVRGLAEVCGGRVWVEDAPGGGAAFRVDLPAARVPVREAV